jgi:hypothetical protein
LSSGHLTDIFEESQFRQAIQGGVERKNWYVDREYEPAADDVSLVLKLQSFSSGGYEAVLRSIDLGKVGAAMDGRGRRRGKRERPDVVSVASRERSAWRARRAVRYKCKEMGATNLVTLTRREGPNVKNWSGAQWEEWRNGGREKWESDHGAFWSFDDWLSAWDKLRRNMERCLGGKFPYVCVLEEHRKGGFHLHMAWTGKVNVGLMRRLWLLSTGGAGTGNVDARYIKVAFGRDRSSKVARYISKYVGKGFEGFDRFNKKRYWSSRMSLPDARRYILKSRTVGDALGELIEWLGFDFGDKENFVVFSDSSGFWYNHVPGSGPDPPF